MALSKKLLRARKEIRIRYITKHKEPNKYDMIENGSKTLPPNEGHEAPIQLFYERAALLNLRTRFSE